MRRIEKPLSRRCACAASNRACLFVLRFCAVVFFCQCLNFTQVFVRTKLTAHRMRIIFGLLNLRAGELHGSLSQGEVRCLSVISKGLIGCTQRLAMLSRFRSGELDFLIVTDLASRGLDIADVQTVGSGQYRIW